MTDLRKRFQALDELHAPELWHEVRERAAAMPQRQTRPVAWSLILAILLLTLALGGAALIGSGLIKLPWVIEASPTPSSIPSPSAPVTTAPAWTVVGGMDVGRSAQTATLLLDGRVLVAGGNRVSGGSIGVTPPLHEATAELFDPATDAWSTVANMAAGRSGHTATLLPGGTVLVVGGSGAAGRLDSAELFDPQDGSWTPTGSLHVARVYHTATLLADGTVLVAGGWTGDAALDSAERYDPATGSWTATGTMIDPRAVADATLLPDGRVLVVGGHDGSADVATAELYDPDTGSWLPAQSPPVAVFGHTITVLPDGSVLMLGGWHVSAGDIESEAVVYDPVRDTWTRVAAMPEARGGHTATLLGNGKVLVAGGLNGPSVACGLVLTKAVLYDPSKGSWSVTAATQFARYKQTATLLLDGSVLIAGGAPNICQATSLKSAERYVPGTP